MIGNAFLTKCCVEGTTPAPDCSDPCVANAKVGATFVGSTNDIYIRIDKSAPCVLADWQLIGAGGGGSFNNFTISDGTNSQLIEDGDTLTFVDSDGITAVVSATDTVTYTIVLDSVTGSGDNILVKSANGLYVPPSSGGGSTARRPFVKIGDLTATSATNVFETDNVWHSGHVLIGSSTINVPAAVLEVTGNVAFGGSSHVDVLGTDSSILGGDTNSILGGNQNIIVGGSANTIGTNALASTISGGTTNSLGTGATINRINNFIGGGSNNSIPDATNSSIVGGASNSFGTSTQSSVICGGSSNTNNSRNSFIGAGQNNNTTALLGPVIVGGDTNSITAANATYAFIGAGGNNSITGAQTGSGSVIVGGDRNTLDSSGSGSAIVAGEDNSITGLSSIGGAFIGSGDGNIVQEEFGAIVTGETCLVDSLNSFIGSGDTNRITPLVGNNNSIVGGFNNIIGNVAFSFIDGAVIPGGTSNRTDGDNSWVMGTLGTIGAAGNGTFLFNSDTALTVNTANQFVAKGSGGVIFYTDSGATTGLQMLAGTSAWVAVSSRTVKKNLKRLNRKKIAERFRKLPVYVGQYKPQKDGNKHLMFVAEEWHEVFDGIIGRKYVQSSETTYQEDDYEDVKVQRGKHSRTITRLKPTAQPKVEEKELAGISYMDIMVATAASLQYALDKIKELEKRIVELENK